MAKPIAPPVRPTFVLYTAETRSVIIPDGHGNSNTCVYDVYRESRPPYTDRVVMDESMFLGMVQQIKELRLLKPVALFDPPRAP